MVRNLWPAQVRNLQADSQSQPHLRPCYAGKATLLNPGGATLWHFIGTFTSPPAWCPNPFLPAHHFPSSTFLTSHFNSTHSNPPLSVTAPHPCLLHPVTNCHHHFFRSPQITEILLFRASAGSLPAETCGPIPLSSLTALTDRGDHALQLSCQLHGLFSSHFFPEASY